MKFESLNLLPRLMENIQALGYVTPTPIQSKSIPPALEGRDVIGQAQTGTGKTAAFAIPLLQRLSTGPKGRLRALIVGPTRELVEQIHVSLNALGKHMDLRTVAIYGGAGMQPQIDGLRRGAEIAIACPGRLLDHIRRKTARLSQVECVILDEADRMLDMGFLPDIRSILKEIPARHQTLLFSATMPPEIRALSNEFLQDPVTVQIAHARPVETVTHALYPVSMHLKTPLLQAILDRTDKGSVLVFTRTKHRAKRLASHLEKLGHPTACLQGNLSQRQRQNAMDGFRSGHYQILVATDLAARGIDVASISHVINFDMPNSVDDYTHRIGRTGRAAKTGDAFTLITREDENMVRAIERVLGSKMERRTLEDFDYNAKPPPATASSHVAQSRKPHRSTPSSRTSRGSGSALRHTGTRGPSRAHPKVTHRAQHA